MPLDQDARREAARQAVDATGARDRSRRYAVLRGTMRLVGECRKIIYADSHSASLKSISELADRQRTNGLSWARDARRLLPRIAAAAASGMARIGVVPHVVEKVLNHAGGQISGVAAIYNRHGYTDEKRGVLEAWGRHLSSSVRNESNLSSVTIHSAGQSDARPKKN